MIFNSAQILDLIKTMLILSLKRAVNINKFLIEGEFDKAKAENDLQIADLITSLEKFGLTDTEFRDEGEGNG